MKCFLCCASWVIIQKRKREIRLDSSRMMQLLNMASCIIIIDKWNHCHHDEWILNGNETQWEREGERMRIRLIICTAIHDYYCSLSLNLDIGFTWDDFLKMEHGIQVFDYCKLVNFFLLFSHRVDYSRRNKTKQNKKTKLNKNEKRQNRCQVPH